MIVLCPLIIVDVVSGLVVPIVAQRLMGKTGEVLVVILLLMAVTSTGSAEIIAVTSILVYDVYQLYLKVRSLKQSVSVYQVFSMHRYNASLLISRQLHKVSLAHPFLLLLEVLQPQALFIDWNQLWAGLDLHMWEAVYVPYVLDHTFQYMHVKFTHCQTIAHRFCIQYESDIMRKMPLLKNNAKKVDFERL